MILRHLVANATTNYNRVVLWKLVGSDVNLTGIAGEARLGRTRCSVWGGVPLVETAFQK